MVRMGLGGLPILLVFSGGALGAIIGFVAFSINTKVFRSSIMSVILRVLLTGVASVTAVLAYLLVAFLISSAAGSNIQMTT